MTERIHPVNSPQRQGDAAEIGPDSSPSSASVQPAVQPRAEIVTTGRSEPPAVDVEAGVGAALQALEGRRERDETTGRFVSGGLAAGKSLSRSEAFQAETEGVTAELVRQVRADLAADAGAAETLRGTIEAYARTRVLQTSLWLQMVASGGPVSSKGRTRALYTAWCAAVDREVRLAQVLGLERRQRAVRTALEVVEAGE